MFMLASIWFVGLAVAMVWYWLSRVDVAPPQVVAMATRIAFPGGLSVRDPAGTIERLGDPDLIAIPHVHAVLVIDYPLTVPATIEVTASIEHGFTRAELVKTICEEYENVYETEEATAATKPIAKDERSVQRRNRTDGLYGIWGYDLEELVITAMRWTCDARGLVRIELHVVT
ncbi:MAG: hypothetical protein NT062_25995 [Proteobacteria bacterium]|nr:hypothetical protein [Pseudomonadota bacterium]